MQTQRDQNVRVVSLANLKAMCNHVSSTCHRYEVSTVSRSRVHVTYSNPDEHGNDRPVTAVFPCYPSPWSGDVDNPVVVLDSLRVYGPGGDETWQVFETVTDCPTLYRSVPSGAWHSHAELRRLNIDYRKGLPCPCVVCDTTARKDGTR